MWCLQAPAFRIMQATYVRHACCWSGVAGGPPETRLAVMAAFLMHFVGESRVEDEEGCTAWSGYQAGAGCQAQFACTIDFTGATTAFSTMKSDYLVELLCNEFWDTIIIVEYSEKTPSAI